MTKTLMERLEEKIERHARGRGREAGRATWNAVRKALSETLDVNPNDYPSLTEPMRAVSDAAEEIERKRVQEMVCNAIVRRAAKEADE